MPELQRLRPDHAPAVLAFELANRAYFANFVSDRGEEYFDHFEKSYTELLAEQDAGTCIFHVLISEDGAVLGLFNLRDLKDGTAVLGYRVAQHVAGRGVATATVQELCQVASQRYGLHTLRAATSLDNVASQRVLVKAGFVADGPADPALIGGRPGTWYQRDLVEDDHDTCVVFLLGYPGVGKRTVGSHLVEMLDGVLVDNALLSIPLLTLFKWDGKFPITPEIWERVGLIREAVLGTIEDLAPKSNSYVFTTVLKDDAEGARQYERIRGLARRRRSLFLSVLLDCEIDEQVRRIDTPDRVARLKGSDPEGYRRHRHDTSLFQPPPDEVARVDTTRLGPRENAEKIYKMLQSRGFRR